jgi:predicted 3-demethylubiquinone-9 3-methyltransferase (glyoxalase superfamily)
MVTICLWFDDQAEEAARFYTRALRDGSIGATTKYDEASAEVSGKPAGSVMTVDFQVEGQRFQALNGGPTFTFSEATSLVVERDTQEELDETWDSLLEGGGEEVQCGWMKDRFGVSWQVVPSELESIFNGDDPEATKRAFQAMLAMKKLDIDVLRRAYRGEPVAH